MGMGSDVESGTDLWTAVAYDFTSGRNWRFVKDGVKFPRARILGREKLKVKEQMPVFLCGDI